MKKPLLLTSIMIFLSLTTIFCKTTFSERQAFALSRYAMVVTDNATLYADASASLARFIVDKSYFVSVSDVVGDYARVRYMEGFTDAPAIEGYVKLSELSFFEKEVSSPYPDVTVETVSDAVLFSDPELTKPHSVVPCGAKVRYFGRYTTPTADLIYVYYRSAVGYIKADCLKGFDLPLHAEYDKLFSFTETSDSVKEVNGSAPSSTEDKIKTSPDAVQIIVIALIILIGLTVLYFMIRPDKLGGKKNVFNDDE